MAGAIRIRVGASLDRSSVEATFGAFEARAKRSQQVLQRTMQAGNGRGGPYRSAPIEREYSRTAAAAERAGRAQATAADRSVRDQMRSWSRFGRFMESELNRRSRAEQRAGEKSVRDAERRATQLARAEQRALDRFATRTSHRATRFFFPPPSGALGAARRFGTDLLRGAGVDFNVGSAVSRGVELQRAAIALSNQGYNPLAENKANRTRVSAETLTSEARGIASKYGMNPADILKAHDAFVSLTGDLDTSRNSMADIAKLSAATGTNIDDMASAQANVVMQLGEMSRGAQGAEKVAAIMRTIAGQGKIGAVEIKDLASGMAGLAAQAPAFAGDVGQNIEKLGALAQVARGLGGAGTAREATIGVQRFVGALQTNARVNEFKAAGVNVYDKNNKIRDPFELIKESLVATKGDPLKMNKLWMSVMAQRGVRGLTNIYTGAGGGKAGLAAVDKEFKKFTKGAAMSQGLVDENADAVANSRAAKAQRFQNNLDEIAQKLAADLLPQLDRLAPQVLKVTEAFAGAVKWATDNPGKAITAAIVASLVRAGLESAARGAIESLIHRYFARAPGSIPAPGTVPTGAPGGALPTAGGLGVVPAAALAAGGVMLATDQASKLAKETGSKFSAASMLPGFNARGDFSLDSLIEDFTPGLAMKGAIRRGKALGGLVRDVGNYDENMNAAAKREAAERARAAASGKTSVPSAQDIGSSVASSMVGRTLNVRVTNASEIKSDGPVVDGDARTPPPGKRK